MYTYTNTYTYKYTHTYILEQNPPWLVNLYNFFFKKITEQQIHFISN